MSSPSEAVVQLGFSVLVRQKTLHQGRCDQVKASSTCWDRNPGWIAALREWARTPQPKV